MRGKPKPRHSQQRMTGKPFRGSLGIPVLLQRLGSTKTVRRVDMREEHVVTADFLDAAMGILIYLSRANIG